VTHKVTDQYRSLAAEVEGRVLNREAFLGGGTEGPGPNVEAPEATLAANG
jgi:hypothetical protein